MKKLSFIIIFTFCVTSVFGKNVNFKVATEEKVNVEINVNTKARRISSPSDSKTYYSYSLSVTNVDSDKPFRSYVMEDFSSGGFTTKIRKQAFISVQLQLNDGTNLEHSQTLMLAAPLSPNMTSTEIPLIILIQKGKRIKSIVNAKITYSSGL